jgi:hypothetical protein
MQRRWLSETLKPTSSVYSQEWQTIFRRAYGIDFYHRQRSPSTSSDSLMLLRMYQHMHTSVDPSTTTKCHWRQWDAMHRFTRRPTSEAHGHTIPSTDGISSPHQSIIERTRATSSTPRANACPTRCNSNTSASPNPPSHTPIK